MSRNRNGVSMVMGVPTVRREKQSYLMDTLQNLVDGMTTQEADDALIVVFVGETDLEYVLQIAKEIEMRFPAQVESGLIEVVSPSPSYYPNLEKLRITLGDSPERVRWRSKQNLDFAFLMSYSQPKGKMFKSAELPYLVQFFQMFYNDKPVDWLLDHLISTKSCNWDKNNDYCKRDKAKVWLHYKPSLFQHIGIHSSLKGKVQKLKDKQFGKIPLFFPHTNPEAEVVSGIKHYKQYTLERAYLGETFFWGLLPQPGDQLVFRFTQPINIKRFYFKSGNAEHPSDKLYNTTVEVLPVADALLYAGGGGGFNLTTDGYIVVGKFDGAGVAQGSVDDSIGKIQVLRLNVHSESDNWAILSEVSIFLIKEILWYVRYERDTLLLFFTSFSSKVSEYSLCIYLKNKLLHITKT
nr:unnamed protein product [Callosobruchus chinensis]